MPDPTSAAADIVRRLLGIRLGRHRIHAPRRLALPIEEPLDCGGIDARFAVVTPVLNQQTFIAAAIGSVLGQRNVQIDYVVKDGLSKDDTVARAHAACGSAARVVTIADSGLASALNQGFALVEGDIFGWLNADDLLLPGALATVGRFFATHDEVDVVYGHRILIDEQGDEIGRWWLPAHDDAVLSFADYIPQETLFWRRGIWDRIGRRLDEAYRFAVDWDLILRFRDAGARFARVPRFLGAFRVHEAQKTAREMPTLGRQEKERLWLRVLGRIPTRWELGRGTAAYLLRHALGNAVYSRRWARRHSP